MNKFSCLVILFLTCLNCNAQILVDEIAKTLPEAVAEPFVYTDYNFESTKKIPIKLKIINPIKSEKDIYEGQIIDFKVVKNVIYDNKIIIERGTPITAQVSIIIPPGMNGIPASIIFNNFKIARIPQGKLTNSYEIFGQDRSLLVFPLKWALTILPPTGSLTNFIMGGHAKVKSKKHITIYYHPEWI